MRQSATRARRLIVMTRRFSHRLSILMRFFFGEPDMWIKVNSNSMEMSQFASLTRKHFNQRERVYERRSRRSLGRKDIQISRSCKYFDKIVRFSCCHCRALSPLSVWILNFSFKSRKLFHFRLELIKISFSSFYRHEKFQLERTRQAKIILII